MAEHVNIEHDAWFVGCDYALDVTVLNKAQTIALDIAGWGLSCLLKRRRSDAVALLTKTTSAGIVISGVFNATPGTNTQKATVSFADTDTTGYVPGLYYYEVKRTDDGSEAVIIRGTVPIERALHT